MKYSSLEKQINRPDSKVFRRAYIKRRLKATGLYESEWLPITSYIKRWGNISIASDDVDINNFTFSGINLQCINNTGAFNHESNYNSLWYEHLTRYNTLLKIEAGYSNDLNALGGWGFPWGEPWGLENTFPTDSSQGIFLIDDEITINSKDNTVNINASSLQSIFDKVDATDIPGLSGTLTASQIIAKIRDYTDGSGSVVFRQIISTTSWNIQSTSNFYVLDTDTTLADAGTTWELLKKLAEAEGFIVYVNRFGDFNFSDRAVATSTSQFSFRGQGFARPNIISIGDYKEALNKTYNSFRLKYLDADTETSYVTSKDTLEVTPTNNPWKYGIRVYEFENRFISDTATAQGIVDNLLTEFEDPKQEITLNAKFHPTLNILDRVDVSYYSYDIASSILWDTVNWDEFNWPDEGQNFDFTEKQFKVLSKSTNLDDFSQELVLREV